VILLGGLDVFGWAWIMSSVGRRHLATCFDGNDGSARREKKLCLERKGL
jgi:hypothetical protein